MEQEAKMELIEKAKFAQATERYEDMALFMELAAERGLELSGEERTLFSTAFKKLADARRMSWSAIDFIEKVKGTSESKLQLIQTYKKMIEAELQEICRNVLRILDYSLIPACGYTEARAFYLKMKGDYFRYLIKIVSEDQDATLSTRVYQTYEEAYMVSRMILHAAHPVRLGVVLNFAVCCYDALDKPDEAVQLIYEALTEADTDVDNLPQDNYVGTVVTLQLLRDNLMLWGVPPYRYKTKTDANVNVISNGKINENELGGSKQGSKGIESTTNCNESVMQSDCDSIENEESDQICGANEIVHKENQCTDKGVHGVQKKSHRTYEINISGIATISQNDEMNCNATGLNCKENKPGCTDDESICKGIPMTFYKAANKFTADDIYFFTESDMSSTESESEDDKMSVS